jgi:hypothetical protein
VRILRKYTSYCRPHAKDCRGRMCNRPPLRGLLIVVISKPCANSLFSGRCRPLAGVPGLAGYAWLWSLKGPSKHRNHKKLGSILQRSCSRGVLRYVPSVLATKMNPLWTRGKKQARTKRKIHSKIIHSMSHFGGNKTQTRNFWHCGNMSNLAHPYRADAM